MKHEVKFPSKSIERKVLKVLRGIHPKPIQEEIKAKTLELANNPRPYGEPKLKPPLDVYNYVAQYRLRIGDYRVLYDVNDKTKRVWILALRRRNEKTYK